MKCVLSLNVLYPYFKGYFSLGAHVSQSETAQFAFGKHAGHANTRGTTIGKGDFFAALAFPSLLRVSLSRSPFPDPLTPKGEAPC